MGLPGFLTECTKITKVSDPSTSSTADVNGTAIDMAGYDGVAFLTSVTTPAAANVLKIQMSSASTVGFEDITGSGTDNAGASDEDLVADILRPRKRYVRAVLVRDTATVAGDIWCVQYNPRDAAITNAVSGTLATSAVIHPSTGTA